MQGRCYYCNKELTERTIKRHIKNCPEMENVIEEKMKVTKGIRNQFLISLKDKYASSIYCIYVAIDANLQLQHLDQFIRDIWVECCGHLSAFSIDGETYNDNSNKQYQMNVYLKDVLNVNEKFEYQYDFGSTTQLILEVVDMIDVPKEFSQIEIIARNNEEKSTKTDYHNSPRDGVCGYEGNKNAQNPYLPQNNKKYEISRKKPIFFDNREYNMADLGDILSENSINAFSNMFLKGKFSFDLEELLKSQSKKQLKMLAENIELKISSSLNKAMIIKQFVIEYENLMKNKMNTFDYDIYKFLHKHVNNNGILCLSDIKTETDLDKNAFLMYQGILFPSVKDDEALFIMPEVMQNIVKQSDTLEFRRSMKNNSKIINIFRGMIKAYGILRFNDVNSLFKRYIVDIDSSVLLSLLNQGAVYYIDEYYGIFDDNDEMMFINEEIDDFDEIFEVIDRNSDYVLISEEELISMSEEDYLSKSSFGKNFINEFASLFVANEDEISNNINALALDIQYRNSEEILKDLLDGIDESINKEDERIVCTMINKLINNIRLWKYKGATLNDKKDKNITPEKENITPENENTIGRNEPCTCGSGKKYKNCCGKNSKVIKLF